MAIDYSTPVGQVRLLIPDTDLSELLLTDPEVQAYLDMEGGIAKLAAAQALDAIASSEVMVSKVIRTQDLQTDGAKVSTELRARASELRRQVRDPDVVADDTAFDIVDFNPYPMTADELASFQAGWY